MGSNNLSGPVPPELGALTGLEALVLANNLGLAGALPQSLTGLDRLRELHAGSTGLCAPTDAAFQAWLGGVQRFRIAQCTAGEPPAAYLTQAVQSREFPVPLVAGERPLLRVFPTAGRVTSEGIPLVRARFYVRGQETHVQDIPGKSDLIPTEVDEGDLSRSANAEIPAWVIQPGLEMVIEVDPDGTLDPGLGVGRRIPETGRLGVDVKAMPPFDLTLIPFIWTATHDSSIVDLVGAMAAGPEHHEMLGETRTLLPIADLAVTAHEAVLVSSNSAFALLSQTDAIRVMEGGTGHYMGMSFPPPGSPIAGVAHRGGRSSYSSPQSGVIAHELGHNLSLGHAPCQTRGRGALDPLYPQPGGTTGAWGYDFRNGRLVSPQWGGPDGLLRATVDQRLPLHQCVSVSAGQRGDGSGSCLRLHALAAALGRDARRQRSLSGAYLRDRRTSRASRLRGRIPRHRADCRQRRPLLVQLHYAGDGRRGREFRLRLRAASGSRMGKQPRDHHAVRTGAAASRWTERATSPWLSCVTRGPDRWARILRDPPPATQAAADADRGGRSRSLRCCSAAGFRARRAGGVDALRSSSLTSTSHWKGKARNGDSDGARRRRDASE